MTIDGKAIAAEVKRSLRHELEHCRHGLTLGILTVEPDFATESFLRIKRAVARELGVSLLEEVLPRSATTAECLESLERLVRATQGVIVQLPLPSSIDTDIMLAALPPSHDVDGMGSSAKILSPVVGAMADILARHAVKVPGARVVVAGRGRLVGAPAARWFSASGAEVVCAQKGDMAPFSQADIIVLGAGDPGFLKPSMVKEGVVILDAGTSEVGGKVAGDADPACASKASLFTPVPGGIGPIAVAMIFKNLLALAQHASRMR